MNNETLKALMPHVYFLLAFLMSFLAVEQSISFANQYGTYSAIVEWMFVFGFVLLGSNKGWWHKPTVGSGKSAIKRKPFG